MIVIAGQVKTTDMVSLNKHLSNLRQFGDQETKIRSISNAITKKNFTIKSSEQVQRNKSRQKQINLAKAKKKSHLGPKTT